MTDAGLSIERAGVAFLSLDVDLRTFPFAVVLVEMLGREPAKEQRVRDLLTSATNGADLVLLAKPRSLSRGSQNEVYGLRQLKRAMEAQTYYVLSLYSRGRNRM